MDEFSPESTVERALLARCWAQRAPVSGSLELTPLCNLNCRMCYVRLSRAEQERRGRLRTAEEWLRLGEELRRSGVLFLLLTGGEPLTHPGFRGIWKTLWEAGFILSLNTNGTLLNAEWADFLAAYRPRRVNISLYGADDRAYEELCRFPGGFERTVRGIRLLRERGVDVKLSISLTRANREDLPKLVALGEELDAPVNVDAYMMPAVREREQGYDFSSRLSPEEAAEAELLVSRLARSPEEYAAYLREKLASLGQTYPEEGARGLSCLAGHCSFSVNWQGNLQPCVMLSGVSAPVFELGFERAWKEVCERAAGIRLNPKCTSCPRRALCRTCAAAALTESGAYDGVPEYLCRYSSELERILRREAAKLAPGQP